MPNILIHILERETYKLVTAFGDKRCDKKLVDSISASSGMMYIIKLSEIYEFTGFKKAKFKQKACK